MHAPGIERRGKERAFDWNAFFTRYRPLAVRFAAGLAGTRELGEDLFQEAARSLYERAERGEVTFESTAHARNYLLRSLRNLAVDAGRRRRSVPDEEAGAPLAELARGREAAPWEGAAATEEAARDVERLARLTELVQGLRPKERQALELRFGAGLAYREIAERTGEAISTLQGRVEAACLKIRRKLGRTGGPT